MYKCAAYGAASVMSCISGLTIRQMFDAADIHKANRQWFCPRSELFSALDDSPLPLNPDCLFVAVMSILWKICLYWRGKERAQGGC